MKNKLQTYRKMEKKSYESCNMLAGLEPVC